MPSFFSVLPCFILQVRSPQSLWVDWNINKSNPNTNDPDWSSFTFNDFVDGDGNAAPIQVATTLLFPILSYQFEPCAPGAPPAITKDKATLERFLREGGPHKLDYIKRYELRRPLTLPVGRSEPARLKIEPDAFRTVLDPNGREKAVLTIDEVEVPPKQDVFVRVFVNKPDASAATSLEDPHYAGSFAFFCCPDPAHAGMAVAPTPKLRYLVDTTETVRKLSQGGSLSADLDVTLVAVPIEDQRRIETQNVTLGRVELAIASF